MGASPGTLGTRCPSSVHSRCPKPGVELNCRAEVQSILFTCQPQTAPVISFTDTESHPRRLLMSRHFMEFVSPHFCKESLCARLPAFGHCTSRLPAAAQVLPVPRGSHLTAPLKRCSVHRSTILTEDASRAERGEETGRPRGHSLCQCWL